MRANARVLVVALDATDHGLMRAIAADGGAPTIARLLAEGAVAETSNPPGLFVGAVWPTLATGTSPIHHRFSCWEEVRAGTYDRVDTSPVAMRGTWFWEAASDAGCRVAVIDVPHTWARRPLDGVMVCEWGCHDRHFGLGTHPPELASTIAARYGHHPVCGIDPYAERHFSPDDEAHRAGVLRTADEERRLWRDHDTGLTAKVDLSLDLLRQGGWDLFFTVFGEAHNVGHQFWHVHDEDHPRHDPGMRADLGDPVVDVYARLDSAVAAHITEAGPDATVLVLLSHGMTAHHDATHLIDPILYRLHRARQVGTEGHPLRRLAKQSMMRMPRAARLTAGALAAASLRRRTTAGRPSPERDHWGTDVYAWPWFLSPNNSVCGGVRLNLVGREPRGIVQPGDADQVMARLTRDLLSIVNVETGTPVVRAVHRTVDLYSDREPVDALPDLIIEWDRAHPIETVWSPTIGVLHEPYTHWRTGDHRNGGLLIVSGPNAPPACSLGQIDARDFAPTVAGLLGVALPEVEGRPLFGIVPASTPGHAPAIGVGR